VCLVGYLKRNSGDISSSPIQAATGGNKDELIDAVDEVSHKPMSL